MPLKYCQCCCLLCAIVAHICSLRCSADTAKSLNLVLIFVFFVYLVLVVVFFVWFKPRFYCVDAVEMPSPSIHCYYCYCFCSGVADIIVPSLGRDRGSFGRLVYENENENGDVHL